MPGLQYGENDLSTTYSVSGYQDAIVAEPRL